MTDFVDTLCAWQVQHGRQHLPWQQQRTPYRVWLSEIMLQQTQVATVIDYFQRFIDRFPTVQTLAQAPQEEVMLYWAGLGYYARARNLHKAAQMVTQEHDGQFPMQAEALMNLPGIGRSTAHAILAFCDGQRLPIMDGNVKRVFCRYFGVNGYPGKSAVEKQLWQLAFTTLAQNPHADMAIYTQALMDFGSMVCKRSRPHCHSCPLSKDCYAYKHQAQGHLPEPKPRQTLPQKHVYMLILRGADTVLLQKRAAQGIWGGLFSLPEFQSLQSLQDFVEEQGLDPNDLQSVASFEHVFSHYKLRISPYVLTNSQTSLREPTAAVNLHNIKLSELAHTALPAPIKTLLQSLLCNDALIS
ncbi:A/G-specific adenine glycosylase [Brackiella oedipodis]|uniref:A/G-specific adenine glycosylase n=1 Tax=Brackiella oedipodis TaxID=124225 RepID=UPI00048CD97F|nr:A/G-specific adenine glycosylase [Brackiella oedipodis]